MNKRFNAEEKVYDAKVDFSKLSTELHGIPLTAAVDATRILFTRIIELSTSELHDDDLIRICVMSEQLDKPISTCLINVSEMTVEKILSCIYKVAQSKTALCLSESLKIDVITVKVPEEVEDLIEKEEWSMLNRRMKICKQMK